MIEEITLPLVDTAAISEGSISHFNEPNNSNDFLASSLYSRHGSKFTQKVKKGKRAGQDAVHYKCNYCSADFLGPTSSALLDHLRKKHPIKCSELIDQDKRMVIKPTRDFFDAKNRRLEYDDDVFMGLVVKWVVKDDQAFSSVENEHFKEMIVYLKKDIKLFSRQTIKRRLNEIYLIQKSRIKDRLLSFDSKYSITCDVWTSKNQLSFLGVTIHYIDDDWKVQEGLLSFHFLEGEHDGVSLSGALTKILEEYAIANRLLGITVDNASSNTTMIKCIESHYHSFYPESHFSLAWNQVGCMAHVINLGAQKLLSCLKQPIDSEAYQQDIDDEDNTITSVSRLAFLLRKIKHSPKLRRLMLKICDEKNLVFRVPVIDVKTRWNSTYDMLTRALEYREIISETFYRNPESRIYTELILTDDDWLGVKNLLEVLRPLKDVTLKVSESGKSLSITNVIPLYYYCTETLKEKSSLFESGSAIFLGVQSCIAKLDEYYDKVSPMAGIALILDPRLKLGFLKTVLNWQDSWVKNVRDQFDSAFNIYKAKPECSSATEVTIEPVLNPLDPYTLFIANKRARTGEVVLGAEEEEFQRSHILTKIF